MFDVEIRMSTHEYILPINGQMIRVTLMRLLRANFVVCIVVLLDHCMYIEDKCLPITDELTVAPSWRELSRSARTRVMCFVLWNCSLATGCHIGARHHCREHGAGASMQALQRLPLATMAQQLHFAPLALFANAPNNDEEEEDQGPPVLERAGAVSPDSPAYACLTPPPPCVSEKDDDDERQPPGEDASRDSGFESSASTPALDLAATAQVGCTDKPRCFGCSVTNEAYTSHVVSLIYADPQTYTKFILLHFLLC